MLLLGLHCPEPVAVGEVESQAFLLLRELSGCVDLKSYLMQHPNLNWPARLGRYLSRVHDAGFWHRDLFVSHVFVDPMTLQFSLIDLQRCQHHARVSWQHRVRDLAALHASLAPTLASPADFQHCIRAYLDDAGLGNIGRLRSRFHVEIERRSCHLLKRSKFQEMRMTAPKVYLRSFALPGDDFERARSQRTEVIGFLQKGADA
jgi:tRNA A-37 threonylcarbamoyl transferase component Bud32